MHPVMIAVVCLFVLSFIVAFITYLVESKASKKRIVSSKDLVDDPQILFEGESKLKDQDDSDIEII